MQQYGKEPKLELHTGLPTEARVPKVLSVSAFHPPPIFREGNGSEALELQIPEITRMTNACRFRAARRMGASAYWLTHCGSMVGDVVMGLPPAKAAD